MRQSMLVKPRNDDVIFFSRQTCGSDRTAVSHFSRQREFNRVDLFHPREFVASLARSSKFRRILRKEHSSNSIVRFFSVSPFPRFHSRVEALHVGSFIVINDGSYIYGLLQVTGSPRQFVGRAVKPETCSIEVAVRQWHHFRAMSQRRAEKVISLSPNQRWLRREEMVALMGEWLRDGVVEYPVGAPRGYKIATNGSEGV